MIDDQISAVLAAACERAIKGSDSASRIIVSRAVVPARSRLVALTFSLLDRLADILAAEITTEEAQQVSSVLDSHRRSFEVAASGEHLAAVEAALGVAPR
jgi:hypothetical protein